MSHSGLQEMAAPSIVRSLSGASAELVLSSLLISILSLALPIATLHVYDRVLEQAGIATFWSLASAVVVALTLETILRILRTRVVARIGGAWEARTHAGGMEVLTRGSKRGEHGQAIGRSRGGRTTKIHALADQDGRLYALLLTPGQTHDIHGARHLLASVAAPASLIGGQGLRR